MHDTKSKFAGQTVTVDKGDGPELYEVEDYWDRVSGSSWQMAAGNPACIQYALRAAGSLNSIPLNDEVLYGKIGFLGYLVHVSEIISEDS